MTIYPVPPVLKTLTKGITGQILLSSKYHLAFQFTFHPYHRTALDMCECNQEVIVWALKLKDSNPHLSTVLFQKPF